MDNAGTQNQQNSGSPAGIYSQQPTLDSVPATNSSTGFFPHPRPDFKSAAPAGDIILAPKTRKKSKKPLIIAGVVVLAIVLVGVISGIIGGNLHKSYSIEDVKTAFNIYSNFLLTGNAEDVEIIDDENNGFSSFENYKFKQALYVEPDNASYFVELKTYYDDFATKVSNLDAPENWRLNKMLDDYSDNLNFILAYNSVEIEISQDFMEKYEKANGIITDDLLAEVLDSFSGQNTDIATTFRKNIKDYYSCKLNFLRKVQEECIDEDGKYTCDADEYVDTCENDKSEQMNNLVRFAVKNILSDAWEIRKELDKMMEIGNE